MTIYNKEEKREIINNYEKSGETVYQWIKHEKVSAATLYRWLKEKNTNNENNTENSKETPNNKEIKKIKEHKSDENVAFIEIEIQEPKASVVTDDISKENHELENKDILKNTDGNVPLLYAKDENNPSPYKNNNIVGNNDEATKLMISYKDFNLHITKNITTTWLKEVLEMVVNINVV